jgi:predicted negative regulator of RcsB-dependent stress response
MMEFIVGLILGGVIGYFYYPVRMLKKLQKMSAEMDALIQTIQKDLDEINIDWNEDKL